MILKDYSSQKISSLLSTSGLSFRIGQFSVNLKSNITTVAKGISHLYGENQILSGALVCAYFFCFEAKNVGEPCGSARLFNEEEGKKKPK